MLAHVRWQLVAGGIAVQLLLAGCKGPPPVNDLAIGGIHIRKVLQAEAPDRERTAVSLLPGDFVIAGRGVRAVVAGQHRKPHERGALLEATRDGMAPFDGISLLSHSLYVRGASQRIRVLRMQIIKRSGMPALRIDGRVLLDGHVIDVAREISVARIGGALSIATRIASNVDEQDVRLGARIAWGGAAPFTPGAEALEDERWHKADWIGSQGTTGSNVFGFGESDLTLRARYEHRGSSAMLQHTDIVQTRRLDLIAGKPRYEKTGLAMAEPGIGRAVRRLGFWRGKPFQEAWVYLPFRPEGSEVRLFDEIGRLLVFARPDAQGSVVLPLTPRTGAHAARFTAVATAYGHGLSDPYTWTPDTRVNFELVIPPGGQIRVRARDASNNSLLPVRIRLRTRERSRPLNLGPDHRASGAGDTVIAPSGDATIPVTPGRYDVIVTHGPEWSMYETEALVTETFSPRVEARLEHQVDPGRWVACDLHVHAAPSPDSEVTLEDRLASLRAEGMHLFVASDHDHATDYAPAAHRLGLVDPASVIGIEIATFDPHVGHFNAYPYPIDLAPPDKSIQVNPAQIFHFLRALDPNLVIQINHPRSEGGIGYFDLMKFDAATGNADPRWSADFDTIEVWNGFDLARSEHTEQVFKDWMAILKRGQRVAATGSSDSHQVRYQLVGYPRTYAEVAQDGSSEPLAIVRAIKNGSSFITSGPFLEARIDGVGPGGTVTANAGAVRLEIAVRVPDWMTTERLEVFVNGELAVDRRLRPVRDRSSSRAHKKGRVHYGKQVIELPISVDTFVIVRVSSAQSLEHFFGRANVLPIAFTNPIFVDADGDGRTRWSATN